MSLAIDTDLVTDVLLADGWHKVSLKSFDLDAYEFVDPDGTLVHGGGQSGVCSTGFTFVEAPDDSSPEAKQTWVSGPMTALLAVKVREE